VISKRSNYKTRRIILTNDYAIVVGGSGLYVDAILKGFDEFPEIDASVRTTINTNYENWASDIYNKTSKY
jgi:tRNA dimethylallyltransferase